MSARAQGCSVKNALVAGEAGEVPARHCGSPSTTLGSRGSFRADWRVHFSLRPVPQSAGPPRADGGAEGGERGR